MSGHYEDEESDIMESDNINSSGEDVSDSVSDTENEDAATSVNRNSVEDPTSEGCKHYRRRCLFVAPCCMKVYACRVCHDDTEQHTLDRKKVVEIRCLMCNTQQPVQKNCCTCDVEFGKYFCEICRLYDDTDKGQFHCDKCEICRVGGKDNFFHCEKCDMCLGIGVKDSHKCVEKMSHTRCPVCLEDLHTSRTTLHVPPCSHLMHNPCFSQMLKTGNYACPLCSKSMVPMSEMWRRWDEEIAVTPMPQEYADYKVQILCRDCQKESRINFHVLGLKCQECGSYNTCRTEEPGTTTSNKEPNPGASGGSQSNR